MSLPEHSLSGALVLANRFLKENKHAKQLDFHLLFCIVKHHTNTTILHSETPFLTHWEHRCSSLSQKTEIKDMDIFENKEERP